MMPPFVPGRAKSAEPRPPSILAPPLRLRYEWERVSELRGSASTPASPAAETDDDALPWLVPPGLGSGTETGGIDEPDTPDAGAAALAEPVAQPATGEWETDQLAVFQDEAPATEEVFESNADLFARLFDELEGSGPPVEPPRLQPTPPARADETGTLHVEEVAARLERIARSLRERGPSGALAGDAADPLGALVAGYLLGLAERSTPRD